MMPITPKGKVTFLSLKPLGIVLSARTRSRGDGSEATERMPEAIKAMRSEVSKSLSYKGLDGSIEDRSMAFAANSAVVCSSTASARDKRTSRRFASESAATDEEAFLTEVNVSIYGRNSVLNVSSGRRARSTRIL